MLCNKICNSFDSGHLEPDLAGNGSVTAKLASGKVSELGYLRTSGVVHLKRFRRRAHTFWIQYSSEFVSSRENCPCFALRFRGGLPKIEQSQLIKLALQRFLSPKWQKSWVNRMSRYVYSQTWNNMCKKISPKPIVGFMGVQSVAKISSSTHYIRKHLWGWVNGYKCRLFIAMWLTILLADLDHPNPDPLVIKCDNRATLALLHNNDISTSFIAKISVRSPREFNTFTI